MFKTGDPYFEEAEWRRQQRETEEYLAYRKLIACRFPQNCSSQFCPDPFRFAPCRLELHHIDYPEGVKLVDIPDSLVQLLCPPCHRLATANQYRIRERMLRHCGQNKWANRLMNDANRLVHEGVVVWVDFEKQNAANEINDGTLPTAA